ncbi:MAG: lipopolysaccharide heptosyltransferase 1, partial [Chloroflexota bacterium]|nr:lipopolysaccharide heptosyltransferase 1 [Chloroflexota bacterium]
LGLPATLVSGPADGDAADRLAASLHVPATVLAESALTQLAGHVVNQTLFVGNDSGITHLAAALGVPTLGMHLATDPDVWGVRGRHTRRLAGSEISVSSALAASGELLAMHHQAVS